MIRAGVYFLEEKTTKDRTEILKMYYPDFKDQIKFYTNPEEYLKPKITEEAVEARIEDIKDKLEKF